MPPTLRKKKPPFFQGGRKKQKKAWRRPTSLETSPDHSGVVRLVERTRALGAQYQQDGNLHPAAKRPDSVEVRRGRARLLRKQDFRVRTALPLTSNLRFEFAPGLRLYNVIQRHASPRSFIRALPGAFAGRGTGIAPSSKFKKKPPFSKAAVINKKKPGGDLLSRALGAQYHRRGRA